MFLAWSLGGHWQNLFYFCGWWYQLWPGFVSVLLSPHLAHCLCHCRTSISLSSHHRIGLHQLSDFAYTPEAPTGPTEPSETPVNPPRLQTSKRQLDNTQIAGLFLFVALFFLFDDSSEATESCTGQQRSNEPKRAPKTKLHQSYMH